MPESPRWLLLDGQPRDLAYKALIKAEGKRASDSTVVNAELDAIEQSVVEMKKGDTSIFVLFREPRYAARRIQLRMQVVIWTWGFH